MKLTLPHHADPQDAAKALQTLPGGGALIHGVTVTVDDVSEEHPQLNTDESYTLQVDASGGVLLHATTIYGALHGLETFSQMVVFDFDLAQHTLPLAPWQITDKPRFPHRGLMIDTARYKAGFFGYPLFHANAYT